MPEPATTAASGKKRKRPAAAEDVDTYDVSKYVAGTETLSFEVLRVDKTREHGQVSPPGSASPLPLRTWSSHPLSACVPGTPSLASCALGNRTCGVPRVMGRNPRRGRTCASTPWNRPATRYLTLPYIFLPSQIREISQAHVKDLIVAFRQVVPDVLDMTVVKDRGVFLCCPQPKHSCKRRSWFDFHS